MKALQPLLLVVLLLLVSVSCSDESTTPPESVSFSGLVRDGNTGAPMDGADVIAVRPSTSTEVARTRTAADGSFTLTGVPRAAVDLLVRKSGYEEQRKANLDPVRVADPASDPLAIRMIPDSLPCCSGVLTVTVKDPNGVGIANARVQVKKAGVLIDDPRSDANGVAVVDNLCPGAYSIRVVAEGFKVHEAQFLINENCEPVALIANMDTVTVCCTGVLNLFVKDGNGAAISGATVKLWQSGAVLRTAQSNSSGAVVFDALCTGQYGISVSMAGYETRELSFSIGNNCEPVEKFIVLEQPACCVGALSMLVKDKDGNPVSGAKVQIKKGGVEKAYAYTNANGFVRVDSLCQGEYSYRVSKDGWQVLEGSFAINAACDPVSKEVTMETTAGVCCSGVFTVIVRDANGNPVSGAKVLVKKNGQAIEDPLTDANGRVVIDGLCAGEYTYRISKSGWKVLEGNFAINTSCDPVTKELAMETEASVCCSGVFTLVVRDSLGQPITGAKVYVKKNGTVVADPLTDANGRVIVDGLCAAGYIYRVTKDGYSVGEGDFTINSSCDPVQREIVLNTAPGVCCTGVLTVTVVDGSNTPVADATVKLWQNGAVKTTLQTNSAGVAIFTNLCKGQYGVDVSKTGFRTREFTFGIGANCEPVNKLVELVP
ncbi:MAG TPA: carboxypeptidase regulatory-like domain-containing protein [Bacteroidota bacterium]|nr:carboxypeptidase regulatory-like domain-containing protein [Bacteroidota bacterium]